MKELAKKTITTIKKKERAGECVVILYSGSHYGVFDLDEYEFYYHEPKNRRQKKAWQENKNLE